MDRRRKILVVARMSPRLDSRARFLVETLERTFEVTTISETASLREGERPIFVQARLIELKLAFPRKRLWYLTGILRVLQLNVQAIWEMLASHYDVIVCSDVPYTLPGLFGKWIFGKKFVYNAHEIAWAVGINPILAFLFKQWEWVVLKSCELWLVPSEERAKIVLQAQGLSRRFVIYENFPISKGDPSDRAEFRAKLHLAGVPQDKPVLMFQGSVTYGRGLEQLIEAAKSGKYHLLVQGDGVLVPYLQKNADTNVTFLNMCPNEETVSWLSAADLSFVYYENDCLNSAYACSTKFYTSIFAGVPIICNRLPAFESFAGKYGGVAFIDSLDPKAINRCISQILNNSEQYGRLKQEILAAREALMKAPRDQIILQVFKELL